VTIAGGGYPIAGGGGGGGGGDPTLGGNVTGLGSNNTVVKIHGATVPISGALTTGNGLYVTGINALSYSALNLAGGANYVTGVLPAANAPKDLGATAALQALSLDASAPGPLNVGGGATTTSIVIAGLGTPINVGVGPWAQTAGVNLHKPTGTEVYFARDSNAGTGSAQYNLIRGAASYWFFGDNQLNCIMVGDDVEMQGISSVGVNVQGPFNIIAHEVPGLKTVPMADADQVVSAADSLANTIIATGTNTALHNLTLTSAHFTGSRKLVRCNTTGFGIVFKMNAGTGVTVLPGTSAWCVDDGTNTVQVG